VTLPHLNRRVHLYLGLSLLPWFLMYGISSVPFAHNQYFSQRDAAKGLPLWTPRLEKAVDLGAPAGPDQLPTFGRQLLEAAGVEAPNFGVQQNASRVTVNAFSFRRFTRVIYSIDEQRLTVEDRRFRWDQFLTGMHARGGFAQDGLLPLSWSLIVDLVCVAIAVWILSGLYMWWGLRSHRRSGWLAILAGGASFLLFTFGL
jgi:hypothetical protein